MLPIDVGQTGPDLLGFAHRQKDGRMRVWDRKHCRAARVKASSSSAAEMAFFSNFPLRAV